jgi:hypothetical protein
MPSMTAIWTALPHGLTGDPSNRRAQLSVYVSMRLTADTAEGTLAAFPAALNWPALLQSGQISLQVQSAGATPLVATIVSAPPEPALWRALFSEATRVVSHQFDDLTQRPINTFTASAIHDQLRNGHQKISATSPVSIPTRAQLQDAYPDLHQAFRVGGELRRLPAAGAAVDELRAFHRLLAQNIFRASDGCDIHTNVERAIVSARRLAAAGPPGSFVPVVADDGTPQAQFAQLYAFHHRPPVDPQNPPPPIPAPDPAQVLDFHQALSALAHYPALLRRLGLVLDLEIRENGLPESPLSVGSGRIQIVPTFATPPVAVANVSPLTAYILDGDLIFTPAPRNVAQPETIAGLLNLALADQYNLHQIDIDGLGLRTINMVAGNALQAGDGDEEDGAAGLPTTRSSGVSAARTGNAAVLAQRFASALANNEASKDPAQNVTLFDEDVTRGFRFDVFDGEDWRSLHARQGHYAFLAGPAGPTPPPFDVIDEGFSQVAAAGRVDGSSNVQSQLYVHDSLMRWHGWNLAAPHPGKAVGSAGPAEITNDPVPGGFSLAVNFAALPGTLPRLRFGRQYQVRARTVDLAGNSLNLPEATNQLQLLRTLNRTPPVLPVDPSDFTYRRFEPIAAPVLVARERFTEGESLARLVIRSNERETCSACATRLMTLVAGSRPADKVIYTAANDRHVAPAKTSLLSSERHGMLDSAFGSSGNSRGLYNLARKEKGRLNDATIIDTTTGIPIPIPDTTGVDPSTGGTITRPAVEFIETGQDSNGPNGYAVHHEAQLEAPYLPDPFSRGATLCGTPGVAFGQSGIVDPQGRLVLASSTLPATTLGVLGSTVQIDFGPDWPDRRPFRLQLAEPSNPDGPSDPAVWDAANRVLLVTLGKAEQSTLRLSSFFAEQDLDALGIWRWILDRNSAQGLPPPDAGDAQTAVVGGLWMLTPFAVVNLVHAVQQPLLAPQFTSISATRDPNATFAYFGATVPVHGKSSARLDVQAQWEENVDDASQPGPTVRAVRAHVFDFNIHLPSDRDGSPPPDPGTVPVAIYDASSDVVTFLAKDPGDESGRTFLSRHEFGDTKHRNIRYQCTATTRFREYFPPEIANDTTLKLITNSGNESVVSLPSSARPATPKLLYAVPYFQWTRIVQDGTLVRTRKTGIRVYLDRPWYSSGDGELLGVVLADPANYPPDEMRRSFVTHWGGDPIWQTDPVPGAPQLANFSRAVATGEGLVVDEMTDEAVLVAGHAVDFDPDRRLWFCDIAVDIEGSYRPFIRLALARYQPSSVSAKELSRILLADFVQLLPERTVAFAPVQDETNTFQLTVQGLTYSFSGWNPGPLESLPDPGFDSFADGDPPEAFPPNLLIVRLEERVPGTFDEAGWQPASEGEIRQASAVPADHPTPPPGGALWTGQVSLPTSRQTGQFRVAIVEEERLLTDTRVVKRRKVHHDPDPDVPHDHGSNFFANFTYTPGGGRIVFAETIEI